MIVHALLRAWSISFANSLFMAESESNYGDSADWS